MLLNDLSKSLTDKFTLDHPHYSLDENMVCYTQDFQSDISFYSGNEIIDLNGTHLDSGEKENQNFRFAIFAPVQKKKFAEAIILLHGLNERYWEKYLPWAYHLAMQTQKPVILFPIAYHINRSPQTWKCPRKMYQFSAYRKAVAPSIENSTFANVALSMRIDNCPELFSMSGIQTYFDIVKLTLAMKTGHFEIFENECNINFFAYSIGALLTETLLMSNPLQLFSDSKAFFFCGGATFDKINGNSRAIMDSQAFANLKQYMINNDGVFKKEVKIPEQHSRLLKDGWMAYLAMSGINRYFNYRENAFKHLMNRIQAIGLTKDFVVPGHSIKETFGTVYNNTGFDVDVIDFPFKYSHETPFPVNSQGFNDTVNQSFNMVFNKASLFLS